MVYTCKWFKQEIYNYSVGNHALDYGWCTPIAYAFRGMCLYNKVYVLDKELSPM